MHKSPLSSPISQAVAFMLSKDQIPQQQREHSMDLLSRQLLSDVSSYSSTEMAAFSEACRQMGYFHRDAFAAMLKHLAPSAASIAADELPSLLWAGARLASASPSASAAAVAPASPEASSSSSSSGEAQHKASVPSNDGIKGSVSSSKIAGLPGLVDFLLGASQVLTGDVDDVPSEELPVLAAALADMEYRDPFLLTVLAEACIDRKAELSETELLSLISSFAAMGRWFFDNRLLEALTSEVVGRAEQGNETLSEAALQHVAAELAGINYQHKGLLRHMEQKQQGQ